MLIFSHLTTSTINDSSVFIKPSPPKSFNRLKMSNSMDQLDTGLTSPPRASISPRAARSEEGGILKKQDNLKDQRKKKSLSRQAYREQKFAREESKAKNVVLKIPNQHGSGIGDGKSSSDDGEGSSIDEDELEILAEQVKIYEKTVRKLDEMKESLKRHISFNMFIVIIIIFASVIMQGIRRSPETIKEMNAKMFSEESTLEKFCATLIVDFAEHVWESITSDLLKK